MKKTTLLLGISIFISVFLFGQNESGKKYYHYKGTIDNKYPITMDISIYGESMYGFYYYDKVGTPISLNGIVNDDNTFSLEEETNKEDISIITGYFKGKINNDNSLSGKWLDKNKEKSFSFEAKEDYLHSCRIKYYEYESSFHLQDNEEYPSYSISLNLAIPVTAPIRAAYRVMTENIREKYFGIVNCGDNQDCIMKYVTNLVAEYNEIGEDVTKEEIEEWSGAYTWDLSEFVGVGYNDNEILVLNADYYQYTGGAHGLPTIDCYIYDTHTGQQMTFEDVFIASKEDALVEKIKDRLVEWEYEDYLFSLEEVGMSDVFSIDGANVTFIYNVYEIAPYVAGPIFVSFKYKEIDEFLNPEFKKKMKL